MNKEKRLKKGTFNLLFLKKAWIFLETQVVVFYQKKQNGTRSKCVSRFIRKGCLGTCIVSMFKQVVLELLNIMVW